MNLREAISPILPGAVPAAAGASALAGAAAVGAPAWLVGIGQALIVAVWTAHAVRQQQREERDMLAAQGKKLDDLELAIRSLDCVQQKRVAQLEGLTPIPTPCVGSLPVVKK